MPSKSTAGFESSVNSEGIETVSLTDSLIWEFESSVNLEGIETHYTYIMTIFCLRAVQIQQVLKMTYLGAIPISIVFSSIAVQKVKN